MPSITKVLKGKSGKTVKLVVNYDPVMDVLTNEEGSPLPDVLNVDGAKVDLRKFKEKWKKELQTKTGTAPVRPSSRKKPVAPFLKEDMATDFEALPDEYDILYEGLTVEEITGSPDLGLITQLSANLKLGSFSKKDLFVLCNFGSVIHLVLRCKESDRSSLEKVGQALAKALKGKLQESPLKPAGAYEAYIDINSKEERNRQVTGILDALKANFSSITLHQVLMTRVPPEQIECMSFDACKRKSVKHHYG